MSYSLLKFDSQVINAYKDEITYIAVFFLCLVSSKEELRMIFIHAAYLNRGLKFNISNQTSSLLLDPAFTIHTLSNSWQFDNLLSAYT